MWSFGNRSKKPSGAAWWAVPSVRGRSRESSPCIGFISSNIKCESSSEDLESSLSTDIHWV